MLGVCATELEPLIAPLIAPLAENMPDLVVGREGVPVDPVMFAERTPPDMVSILGDRPLAIS